MKKRFTPCIAIAACALMASAHRHQRPGPGPDQAEMGPRVRNVRALPQVVGLGRRRVQEKAPTASTRSRCSPHPAWARKATSTRACSWARWTSSSPVRRSPRATRFPRLAVSYYPFTFRDADHVIKYGKSDVFKELTEGYKKATGNTVTALTYYGARHATSNKAFTNCDEMKGLKMRVPDSPAYTATAARLRRQPHADRLCRGVPGIAERHRGRAGEPAAHHRGQEVL
jgi:hypothetical protein